MKNINRRIKIWGKSSSDSIEGSMTDIRNSAQGANILEGLRISGGSAESNRSEIQTWLNSIGF